ncbi:sporulation YhaL family protein [Priestia abyssalis]|uniref:sporulation YhaL family protein n=1 Tax=Priestia abyssalis TaxID=1221450 RepID=UPI0009955508|nr:sporulation YhaL family protein [Priestia abyssalis]
MLTLPFWVYLVVMGIFFSGFMAIRTGQKEREIDDVYIEKEGQIYIQRMEVEREKRKQINESSSM